MTENKLTYDEFMAETLKNIPEAQQKQWLEENTIAPAPFLPAGWVIMANDKQLPGYKNQDDFQDYEHAREIE